MASAKDPLSSEIRDSSEEWVDLLAAVSRSLSRAPDHQAEEAVEGVLKVIGERLQVDRVTVWKYQTEESQLDLLSSWQGPNVGLLIPDLGRFPWVTQRLSQGKPVEFSDPEDLPPDADTDKESFLDGGVQEHYSYPLRMAEETLGVLTISVLRGRTSQPDRPTGLFRLISDMIVGALSRSRLLSKKLQSDHRYRSLVASSIEAMWCLEFFDGPLSLEGSEEEIVAEIYDRGHVVEANDVFAQAYGYADVEEMGTWRLNERLPENSETMRVLRSLTQVGFVLKDFETVELDRDGNAVIFVNNCEGQIEDGHLLRIWGTARDLTESRQQESELEELKRQLARAARLGTMGELSAAITHEIGQPLAAIATNARAAQRFLAGPDPDLDEVSEILEDIIADDQRVAAVSQNIRALVASRETPRESVDVGELVLSVMEILRNDATFKNVEIVLNLDEGTPRVLCDGVQIQQVVINLVLNGCEAMVATPPEDRELVVGLAREGADRMRVSVRDSGVGFQGTPPDDLFQPFETSKEEGLGMGLSISRTIVESHGGKIWGVENPEGGATFHFTLPTTSPSAT